MKDSPAENVFWLCDGRTLKNVKELLSALEDMNEGVFKYHVNDTKDDFANWIRDIFNDKQLAEALSKVKDKNNYTLVIKAKFQKQSKKKK